VRDATVTNARNSLALNFTDPANVELHATRIRSAIEGGQVDKGRDVDVAHEAACVLLGDPAGVLVRSGFAPSFNRRSGDCAEAKKLALVKEVGAQGPLARLTATFPASQSRLHARKALGSRFALPAWRSSAH
jgi:hypothetical protein